ncbi:hypothetical protein [Colwellia echini]|uniref:DUF3887 domain-containing protein n=1 Tax=Colwellia echini TaxID=1982103 RepID=A0ABY3MWA3_9GAMM|nr:hypothetical protein [Colwellia echini]TYK65492.1 hypothetical protein CWS31_010385 [Colwellia echini]
MKVKQAIKHLTLLSILTIGITACSTTPEPKPVVEKVIVEEPVIVEEEETVVNTVINNGVINIPVMRYAQIFAEYSDSLPAVLNYFTNASKEQIIDFYQQAFGEPYSQEVKRERLTLKYKQGDELMRVVISQQNNKRQVDVIVESNSGNNTTVN